MPQAFPIPARAAGGEGARYAWQSPESRIPGSRAGPWPGRIRGLAAGSAELSGR